MLGSKHYPSNEVNIKKLNLKPSISTNYFSHNRVVQQLALLPAAFFIQEFYLLRLAIC